MYCIPFVYQNDNYGPKACLKETSEETKNNLSYSKSTTTTANKKSHNNKDNALAQQLTWTSEPKNVLLIKKPCNQIFESFVSIISYLIEHHKLIIFIEENDFNHEYLAQNEQTNEFKSNQTLNKFKSLNDFNSCLINDNDNTCKQIDLIICLGGDGTLLHASTLFQQSCPPVLSIHMGSLGFLCPFEFDSFKEYISSILKGNVPILIRSRLKCRFEKIETFDNNNNETASLEWLALNEIVISRGQNSFLTNLDLYINGYKITSVQGDGLIISTPTGSTAYAMAAGASMCHPSVPSIIIAPICPHSLSFRPIVVPAGVELKIQLSSDARNTASFSVDGRANHELNHGYQICVTTSEYPLATLCRNGQLNDWFEGLAICLNWNLRKEQLPLNICYTNHSNNSSSSQLSDKNSSNDN